MNIHSKKDKLRLIIFVSNMFMNIKKIVTTQVF